MSATIQFNKSDIEACQDAVQNFRINELHQLVSLFKYPKLGKKQELVNRALSILNNPKYQFQAIQKVHEIQASIRVRDANQPYPVGTTSNQQAANNMHNQQHNQYPMNPANMPATYNNSYMNATLANFAAYGAHFAHHVQHNFPHQMPPMNQPQQMVPMHRTGLVTNLRTVELPFFDFIKPVFQMTELPAYPMPTRPGEARYSCQFGIAPDDIQKLTYPDDKELPRYELQLRVFLLETSEEQQDAFPPGSVVRLDDYIVTLPAVIPTNKPNAEQKRYPRPVNLTPYCRPARGRERPHRLNFEWNGDKRAWAFTVTLVKRVNSEILLKRIRANPQATRTFEVTKMAIIKRLNGEDEDDVQMDSMKISLIDPLGRIRIRIPVRAVDCTHLQTFDLNNYLMMNEKRPVWKCPVCDKNAIYSKLIIEDYFEQMLKTVGPSVEEVELLRDGTWRIPKQNVVESVDSDEGSNGGEDEAMDDDDDIMIVEPTRAKKTEQQQKVMETAQMTSGSNAASGPSPNNEQQREGGGASSSKGKQIDDDDIICLSSDDEEERLATAIAASNMNNSPSVGTPNSNGSGGVIVQNQSNIAAPSSHPNAAQRQQQQHSNTTQGNGGPALAKQPPMLRCKGHEGIFRPPMDELAKSHVAQQLAFFLQNIHNKNKQFSSVSCNNNAQNRTSDQRR